MNNILNTPLANQIKSFLYNAGITEQYIAFDYTTYVLQFFILSNDDSFRTYQEALTNLENEYNICRRTLCHSLNTVLKKCKNEYCSKRSNRTHILLKDLKKNFEKNMQL